MRSVLPGPPPARVGRPGVGVLVLARAFYAGGGTLLDQLAVHRLTVAVFVIAITVGELFRLRMPSGREAAPLASASALAFVFLAEIDGQPAFDVDADFVVLAVAAGLLLAAVVRAAEGARSGSTRSPPDWWGWPPPPGWLAPSR